MLERLRLVLERQDLASDLLVELDRIARDYGSYEYGLPLHSEAAPAMREALYRWLVKLEGELAKNAEG